MTYDKKVCYSVFLFYLKHHLIKFAIEFSVAFILFCAESESDGEPEIQIIEEEVQKVVIDEDGNEKTVTVTVQKEVIKEPSEKKKDGESKKKQKEKGEKGKDKDKSEKKDKKSKDKSKSEKDGDEKEGKKSSKKDKDKTSGSSLYGGKDLYGKDSKKEKKKLTADTIGDMPEVINLTRRLDAVENGLKGLRNIVDSMVNQVDFGDGVGEILKAQLDQVQQQITTVELIPKEEPKESKKKKKGKKGAEEVPQTGIITEGGAVVGGGAPGQTVVGPGGVVTSAPGAPVVGVLPVVIPPPSQRGAADGGKAGRTPSRKEGRKAGIPMKGAAGSRPDSQDGDKPAPLKKRTTLRDLQLRKKAREEGVSVEEIEAREAENEKDSKDDKKDEKDKDKKDKKDDDADDTSSSESLDSEEQQAAMDEMLMEEIEAALENAADDPEAQAYALRLSLEQMSNMKNSISKSHDEFRKDMEKNKHAINQIARELSLFRAARKAQVRYTMGGVTVYRALISHPWGHGRVQFRDLLSYVGSVC